MPAPAHAVPAPRPSLGLVPRRVPAAAPYLPNAALAPRSRGWENKADARPGEQRRPPCLVHRVPKLRPRHAPSPASRIHGSAAGKGSGRNSGPPTQEHARHGCRGRERGGRGGGDAVCAPPAQSCGGSGQVPAARCGGPGSPRLSREQQGPGAADDLRGPGARRMSGHGRRGCGSLRGRRSSGTPGGLGPHSPPGPAPSGASMQPAASPGRGDPVAAAATRPWIPAQRIGQQPGGRGGGEEPAGRGAQLLRGPGLPILPAAPQHRCGPAPVRARPLSFRALRTLVLRSRTQDLAAASHPFAHTHPAAALTSVHLFSPRYLWGANY